MATPYDDWARQTFGQWYREQFIPELNPIATMEEDYLAKRRWALNQSQFGYRHPNRMDFPMHGQLGSTNPAGPEGAISPHRPQYGVKSDALLSEDFKIQRQAERSYKGRKAMLAKGWNPATIKKAYGAPARPPWPVPQWQAAAGHGGTANPFDRFTAYPRMSGVNQLSDAAAKKLGMVTEWKKMLNMPKWELAGQLSSFVSKWGKPALKLIYKLPK